jgi:hypothetical protein
MLPKQFLLDECKNLKSVLQETLRFDYGLEGSKDFYEECELRLTFITDEIEQAPENDVFNLRRCSAQLDHLSKLISRIERSSISEYSWPFVCAFKDITQNICKENKAISDSQDPKIHVLSEGGLSSYKIYAEQIDRIPGKRRILTIVFPRTLKHFVLLHPILGHEIGHAIFKMANHQKELITILNAELLSPSETFKSVENISAWLFSNTAPDDVQKQIAVLSIQGINESDFFPKHANLMKWLEEILCDLLGLLIFGPSYIGAQCNLLLSMEPSGLHLGKTHPPTALRINLVLKAAKALGYDSIVFDKDVAPHAKAFWDGVNSLIQPSDWFNVFTEDSIKNTLTALQKYLSNFEKTLYPIHDKETIQQLSRQLFKLIPPVGSCYNDEGEPDCKEVDFRHILYAGWIASEFDPENLNFAMVNRLCEHGIMQQNAISLFANREK